MQVAPTWFSMFVFVKCLLKSQNSDQNQRNIFSLASKVSTLAMLLVSRYSCTSLLSTKLSRLTHQYWFQRTYEERLATFKKWVYGDRSKCSPHAVSLTLIFFIMRLVLNVFWNRLMFTTGILDPSRWRFPVSYSSLLIQRSVTGVKRRWMAGRNMMIRGKALWIYWCMDDRCVGQRAKSQSC